jgi:hypothetical protein
MEIETLGQALDAGFGLRARCALGKHREGLKSRPACVYFVDLKLETMVWTHGREFPISALATRLKCPRCGSRTVTVAIIPPPGTPTSMPVRLLASRRSTGPG